jgi:hypothetical protein
MKSIGQLKKEHQDKVTKFMDGCGIFFAFSNEQFVKNRTPLAEGEVYVALGAGAYIVKSKVSAYQSGMKQLTAEYKKEVTDNKLRKANILHELNNHECFYTGDVEDALDALGSDYTLEEVMEVFNTCEQHA